MKASDLLWVASAVGQAINDSDASPVLSAIYFKALSSGKTMAIGFDQDIAITCTLPHDLPGLFTGGVHYKTLVTWLRALPDDADIDITSTGSDVTFKHKKRKLSTARVPLTQQEKINVLLSTKFRPEIDVMLEHNVEEVGNLIRLAYGYMGTDTSKSDRYGVCLNSTPRGGFDVYAATNFGMFASKWKGPKFSEGVLGLTPRFVERFVKLANSEALSSLSFDIKKSMVRATFENEERQETVTMYASCNKNVDPAIFEKVLGSSAEGKSFALTPDVSELFKYSAKMCKSTFASLSAVNNELTIQCKGDSISEDSVTIDGIGIIQPRSYIPKHVLPALDYCTSIKFCSSSMRLSSADIEVLVALGYDG